MHPGIEELEGGKGKRKEAEVRPYSSTMRKDKHVQYGPSQASLTLTLPTTAMSTQGTRAGKATTTIPGTRVLNTSRGKAEGE